MKLRIDEGLQAIHQMIVRHYDQYNIIHDSQLNQNTYFFVVEKFFIRNSSRASLSVVMVELDPLHTLVEAIGSGGGQGWLFKFDWGAKESFEKGILKILDQNQIIYRQL
ncbi:MAG TPA: DUF6054 family protein [Candidatus Izemoplasmatales bacterium]|nr:DUF6054 family protein [Candidatus Izemoplasmatales bacterium]